MNKIIKLHFAKELTQYQDSLKLSHFEACWNHLERAHILSQNYWKQHFVVHWWMFSLALKTKNRKEILGQLPRLLLAIPGSIFNRAPKGNIGSSRVGIFEPMELPDDLRLILELNKNKN